MIRKLFVSISHNFVLIIYQLPKKTLCPAVFVISAICVEIRTEMGWYLLYIRDPRENELNFSRSLLFLLLSTLTNWTGCFNCFLLVSNLWLLVLIPKALHLFSDFSCNISYIMQKDAAFSPANVCFSDDEGRVSCLFIFTVKLMEQEWKAVDDFWLVYWYNHYKLWFSKWKFDLISKYCSVCCCPPLWMNYFLSPIKIIDIYYNWHTSTVNCPYDGLVPF